MRTHLVWLRNDLRTTDNQALYAACSDPCARVLAVYIATPQQWRSHGMAPRQVRFIWQNLELLQQRLAELGIELYLQRCADFDQTVPWLVEFCRRQAVDTLFYNYQYEFNECARDRAVERALPAGTHCLGFHDSVLLPPGTVRTGGGEMYKVYTPFRNAFLQRLTVADLRSLPVPSMRPSGRLSPPPIAPFDYPDGEVDSRRFPAGEEAALARLRHFCRERVADYTQQRDIPALDGTSALSPYLALGVISPRQCFNRLRAEHPELLTYSDSGAFSWLNELIWREFYRHLLVAYPRLCKHQPFITWTDRVQWRETPQALAAWQQGLTGYPIVDAAMRQLNSTGWMHNRLRMIVASFLVKDLLIDWRAGERYFMSQLLDGDLAANNGGWQWAASSGTDAAPYFRIFNPTTQGERFDPEGVFIRHWLPELADVPGKEIHRPLRWAEQQNRYVDYPLPIVDHQQARQLTLAAFAAAKSR